MRKSIKYITLTIGSIVASFLTLVFVLILLDYPTLEHKATLILPSFFFVFLITAVICTIVLSFKFSNGRKLRSLAIITILLYLFSAIFYFLGHIINPQIGRTNDTSITVSTKQNIVDKDVFLNDFFNVLTVDDSFTYTKNSDTISEDGNFTTSNYTLTSSPIPLTMVAFDVKFNNTSNSLESVSVIAAPDNSLWVSLIFNWAVLSLDPTVDITQLDKQCGLSPFVEGTLRAETDMFSVLKMSSDKFISAAISIK